MKVPHTAEAKTYLTLRAFLFLHTLSTSPAFIVCRFVDDGHSDWCEMIPHRNFDVYFSNNEQC